MFSNLAAILKYTILLMLYFGESAQSVAAEKFRVHKSMDYIAAQRLQKHSGLFTINPSGYVVDGPKQGKTEPIDFTKILSNESIAEMFVSSVFGCSRFGMKCENNRVWSKGLMVPLKIQSKILTDAQKEILLSGLRQQFLHKGVTFQSAVSDAPNSLMLVIEPENVIRTYLQRDGSAEDLWVFNSASKYSKSSNVYTIPYRWRKSRCVFKKIDHGLTVYIETSEQDNCLFLSVFAFFEIGLIGPYFPSILSAHEPRAGSMSPNAQIYRVPTEADGLFLKAISSGKISGNLGLVRSKNEMMNFLIHARD